ELSFDAREETSPDGEKNVNTSRDPLVSNTQEIRMVEIEREMIISDKSSKSSEKNYFEAQEYPKQTSRGICMIKNYGLHTDFCKNECIIVGNNIRIPLRCVLDSWTSS